MANKLLLLPSNRLFNNSNIASPGGTAELYLSGGTTPANFLDSGGVSLGSTITANGLGQLPNAYQDETIAYRLILKDKEGVQIDGGDIDPFFFGIDNAVYTGAPGVAASSRAAMAAIANPVANQAATLTESGREGAFVFNSSDLSAQVTADTAQGIYVAPSSDTTGASGAWVRKFTGPADPSWFGAALDGTTDDTTPLSKALALAGYVHVPEGKTLKMAAGQVVLPSSAFLHVVGEIAFNPTASQYAFVLRDNVSNVTIFGPGKITSSTDLGFLTFIRLEQAAGTTLDGLTVEGIKFEYNATPGNSSDRWALAGTGDGTRKNVRIRNNTIKGSMQLCATLVATGTFRDSEIVGNRITDARSNAISLLSSGMRGSPCTLDNVKVTDNVIITTQATNSTSLGVAVGIDSTGSPDVNVNIKNLTIARNRFDLSASSTKTADIYIRLGNKCAAIGGFDSVADNIVIADNGLSTGFNIDQNPTSSATLSQITNFVFRDCTCLAGDINLSYLADGANLIGNTLTRSAAIRPGLNCGTIYSQGNTYGTLTPFSADAVFTWRSLHDTYLGSVSGTDRTVTLNANAGKVQTAYFDGCTIDSSTSASFGIRSAIYTLGTGNPTVQVRNLTSSTDWGSGLFEVTTGSVTQVADSGTLATANNWAADQTFSAAIYKKQAAPIAKTTSATLLIADLLTAIVTSTSTTAVTLTLPTGTLADAGIQNAGLANDRAFEWVIINLGSSSGAVTVAAATGHTIVGSATVAIGTSAQFRTRKTAANTFITYRIA